MRPELTWHCKRPVEACLSACVNACSSACPRACPSVSEASQKRLRSVSEASQKRLTKPLTETSHRTSHGFYLTSLERPGRKKHKLPLKNLLLNVQSMMIRDIQERRSQLSSVREVERKRGASSSCPVPREAYLVVALRVRTGGCWCVTLRLRERLYLVS